CIGSCPDRGDSVGPSLAQSIDEREFESDGSLEDRDVFLQSCAISLSSPPARFRTAAPSSAESGLNTAKPLHRISAGEWTGKVRGNVAEARILFASSKVSPHPAG